MSGRTSFRISVIPLQEEQRINDPREIPCKDFDFDCFALDGKIPFDDYGKCYAYAPELGRCIFCQSK